MIVYEEKLQKAQEKMKKAQEDLEAFQQQLHFSEQTTAETTTRENYESTLQYLRTKVDDEDFDLTGIRDYATAMALAQISIEKRIAEIQEEVDENTFVEIPLNDEPPVDAPQPAGVLTRLKNWFKKLFAREPAREEPPPPPPREESRLERLEKQKIMANLIGQLTVESRAGEVRKMERPQGSGPDDPPVTKEELETLRKHGIRSSGGNFLLKRYGPVFNPVRDEVEEFAGKMEQYGFNYALANEGLVKRDQGMGQVVFNVATAAMVKKGMELLVHHLETEGVQEYMRLVYDGTGDVLNRLVKGSEPITREQLDEHVMSVSFTRGLDPFFEQFTRITGQARQTGGVLSPEQEAKREFFKNASILFSKMEIIYQDYLKAGSLEALPPEFRDLIEPYEKLRRKISEIGRETGEARLDAINAARKSET